MKSKTEQVHRRRAERKDRLTRLVNHREKIATLRALIATYEKNGMHDDDQRAEVRRLKTKIRTLEQQIRYIGEFTDEAMMQLHAHYTKGII